MKTIFSLLLSALIFSNASVASEYLPVLEAISLVSPEDMQVVVLQHLPYSFSWYVISGAISCVILLFLYTLLQASFYFLAIPAKSLHFHQIKK